MTYRVLADSVLSGSAADVLAYIPSPPRGVWEIGPFPLRAYALCIIIGIVAAIWLGEKRWQQRGGEGGTVLDVAMFAVPFGLVGGRLYHVATDWQKYFGANATGDWWAIWEGGLGIWGAVLLGGVGAWIACRVYRIPLPAFGDAIAPGILLAQAIGRLGNWFNQELYGRETTVPWGLEIYLRFDANGQLDMMDGVSTGVVEKVVHPTFLYELVWNLLGVAALLYLDKKFRIGHGRLFALYVAVYCFGRFWVELLRDDEATHIAGIRVNSFTSAIVFLCAIAYFVLATKGRETAEQLRSKDHRPWPWQLSKLRAYGAAGAATAAATATADGDTAEDGSVTLTKDEEAEPADGEPTGEGAADEGAADKGATDKGAADKEPTDKGAADKASTDKASGSVPTATDDNETGSADDNPSETAEPESPATRPEQTDPTKSGDADDTKS
ncbi:prolipoprotein diacylglyceryl transferase [Nocardia otitidiscaviarum]|uniref:prolipoprotein diacylglyceryl transferase n=1 Tax=Nocardia otitidiscaviarum TaxID=1823 RepID=UPI0002FB995B|nr:prolipoprotein diacylglyceryl transferase [Nocardia otitidiscaviarum]